MARIVSVLGVALVLAAGCGERDGNAPSPSGDVEPESDHEPAKAPAAPVPDKAWVPPTVEASWWSRGEQACPAGSSVRGAAWPAGTAIWCEAAAGVRHGPYTAWHDGNNKSGDGVISEQGLYRQGQKHGVWLHYAHSGKKQLEITFKEGKQHGMYREYWPNGAKKLDGWYRDGIPHGTFSGYDDKGQIIASTVIRNGNGSMIRWHANRAKQHEYRLVDGVPHGVWTTFDQNGARVSQITYRAGRRHGPARRWDSSGALIEEGSYVDDMKHGPWRKLSAAGKVVETVIYAKGQQVPAP